MISKKKREDVMVKMRIIVKQIMAFALMINLSGQESTYLAQKIMLENNMRSRIESALQKIMDDHRYVLDISVDLKFTPTVTEEVTFRPSTDNETKNAVLSGRQNASESVPLMSNENQTTSTMTGIPIPGFDFQIIGDDNPIDQPEESNDPIIVEDSSPSSRGQGSQILSQSYTDTKVSMPIIENLDISCILPEGSAPELIENVRQIIMVASHFDRSRGDVLSVMTASFRQRKDERTAESIILRSIAKKIDELEERQSDAEAQVAEDWKSELEGWKNEETRRREEERAIWRSELDRIENERIAREFQNERKSLIERDSIRMNQLTQEISQLKDVLSGSQLSEEQEDEFNETVSTKEEEREQLDSIIAEKLAMLEQTQNELENISGGMNNLPIYLMSAISLLAVLALAAVILFNGRSSKPSYVMPPPWMMPPPNQSQQKKKVKNDSSVDMTSVKASISKPESLKNVAFEEDPSVIQSEMIKTKDSLVSMSVGEPEVATNVVKDWLEQEAPPAPVESNSESSESSEQSQENNKKSKKKK